MNKEAQLSSEEMIGILLDRIQSFAPRHELHRTDSYVGLVRDGSVDNFVLLKPKGYGLRLDVKLPPEEPMVRALRSAGVTIYDHRPYAGGPGFYPVKVTSNVLVERLSWLGLMLEKAFRVSSRYGGA